mgnify:CR=1 FL=1
MTEKLILVEGKEDIQSLKKFMDLENTKIISFDFESHKLLDSVKSKHHLVEEYFSEQDKSMMDDKALNLTTNWYKHEKLKKMLEYNGVNLGSLLEIELIGYFFEYIKRIIGIHKIIKKESPKIVFTSFLGKCTEIVCKGMEIEVVKLESEKNTSLFFDSVDIPIGIRGKIISIKISRANFLRIRRFSIKCLNILYNLKPNFTKIKNKKIILLLDFNPNLYSELLKILSESKFNVLLLNQRRPAIWNYSSLQIMKNSNCKIIELEDFSNKNTNLKMDSEKLKMQDKLYELWKNKVFYEIFSIEGIEFWDAIKDSFSSLTTKRFIESVERFILLNELFNKINPSCVLEWAHVGIEDKIIISLINEKNIPNMFLQHGLYIQNEKFFKYNSILPIFPSNNSKHIVWGKVLEDFLLKHNVEKNNIIKIGSPRHDKFFEKEHGNNFDTVLIAANGFFHNNSNGTDTKSFIKMEDAIRKICDVIKKSYNKKIIVKLHPGHVSYDIKPLIHEIDPTIKIYQNENIADLLEKCDVMISLNFSTVILDALIAQKPTMVFLPEEQGFEDEIPLKKGAVLYTSNIDQFEKIINDLISNKKIRNELIHKGNDFVNEYFINKGNASNELAKILYSFEK